MATITGRFWPRTFTPLRVASMMTRTTQIDVRRTSNTPQYGWPLPLVPRASRVKPQQAAASTASRTADVCAWSLALLFAHATRTIPPIVHTMPA